jgi:hypothetical protein
MLFLTIMAVVFACMAALCAFAAGRDRSFRFTQPLEKLSFARLATEQDRQHILNHWAARFALLSAVLQILVLLFPELQG